MEPWQRDIAEYREAQFQAFREKRERFGEPVTRRKTMTHYELQKACEAIIENLGIEGTLSVVPNVTTRFRKDKPTVRELDWSIRFWTRSFEDVSTGRLPCPERCLEAWSGLMRAHFAPVSKGVESDLAKELDAHKAVESAA